LSVGQILFDVDERLHKLPPGVDWGPYITPVKVAAIHKKSPRWKTNGGSSFIGIAKKRTGMKPSRMKSIDFGGHGPTK
jgi:hypothetical protein